jgi:hypothetical protein
MADSPHRALRPLTIDAASGYALVKVRATSYVVYNSPPTPDRHILSVGDVSFYIRVQIEPPAPRRQGAAELVLFRLLVPRTTAAMVTPPHVTASRSTCNAASGARRCAPPHSAVLVPFDRCSPPPPLRVKSLQHRVQRKAASQRASSAGVLSVLFVAPVRPRSSQWLFAPRYFASSRLISASVSGSARQVRCHHTVVVILFCVLVPYQAVFDVCFVPSCTSFPSQRCLQRAHRRRHLAHCMLAPRPFPAREAILWRR